MRFWGLVLVLAEIAERLERERRLGLSSEADRPCIDEPQKASR
jgi:hypothetical protein